MLALLWEERRKDGPSIIHAIEVIHLDDRDTWLACGIQLEMPIVFMGSIKAITCVECGQIVKLWIEEGV